MIKFVKNKYFNWIISLITLIILVACSSNQTLIRDNSANIDKIRIAYMPNFASLHDIITGINSGIFKEEGLEVELIEFADGPTIIASLESGSIDIGNIGPGAHKLAIEGRAEVVAFSQLGNADELIARSDRGIDSIKDLRGKKIGTASGTSAETILKLALLDANLSEKDVEIIDMDASAIVTAMLSGSIDVAATWSPNTTLIKRELKEKVVVLADNSRYRDQSPAIASYVTFPGYSEKNNEKISKFLKGLYRAMDYRAEHMKEVSKWVATQIGSDITAVQDQLQDGEWLTSRQMIQLINTGILQQYYEKQQKNLIVSGIVDISRNINEYVLIDQMSSLLKEIK
ncbi:ABC transporter substrate-binding protein [Streptococcus suis]|uniref:ABC transporter substrate-binding protein n=1 Tax=Streptococcus suis TaxID=1307 RepID=UPI0020C32BB5|nr:ABC transporter substrate-binding protein [Streptococcus suis]MCP8653833.1 ABC transporter substrate-binding protein [Streptococcus suis]